MKFQGTNMSDVLELLITGSVSKESLSFYPTQKPGSIENINSSTNEGDIICDFFVGSGTTSVYFEKLNRKWILILILLTQHKAC